MVCSTLVPSDLETYIDQAFDQIMYDGCEPGLNSTFWNEYKQIRETSRNQLLCSGVSQRTREYRTLLHVKIINSLQSLGWKAFFNGDGCVEFYV